LESVKTDSSQTFHRKLKLFLLGFIFGKV